MDVPEALVTEILLRLPVKSLLKFKVVCKSWYDVIRSPQFVDRHLKHASQKSRTKYMIIPKQVEDCPANMLKSYSLDEDGGLIPNPMATPFSLSAPCSGSLHLYGPCHGIVCIVGEKKLYLCNPATRECQRIPQSPHRDYDHGKFHFHYNHSHGFGFDPRTNEYKVVSILFSGKPYFVPGGNSRFFGTYTTEIYELGSNSWRTVETALPEAVVESTRDSDGAQLCWGDWQQIGLLFNGCIHWRFGYHTITFDISDEVFRAISDPPEEEDTLFTESDQLVVFEDCLALVRVASSDPEDFVSVWVMTEYGVPESWSKRFTIPLPSDLTSRAVQDLSPVICWNNDMLLIHDYDRSSRRNLISCKLSGDDHQFRVVDDEVDECSTAVIIRDESLVSVSIGNP